MRFRYAGGDAMVSDAMCAAILGYASALTGAGENGVADLRSVNDQGQTIAVKIFLSGSSQLWFADEPGIALEVDDRFAIAGLHEKTTAVFGRHTHQRAEWGGADWDSVDFDLDHL